MYLNGFFLLRLHVNIFFNVIPTRMFRQMYNDSVGNNMIFAEYYLHPCFLLKLYERFSFIANCAERFEITGLDDVPSEVSCPYSYFRFERELQLTTLNQSYFGEYV